MNKSINQQHQESLGKKILGESLTVKIHRLKNQGYNSDEIYSNLTINQDIQKHIKNKPLERQKILENLKISVCARVGEAKTMEKIKNES